MVETGSAPADEFGGGVAMASTSLSEKGGARRKAAFESWIVGMPIGTTGVGAGMRREVVYARRALRWGCRGDAGCSARHAHIHLWSHVHAWLRSWRRDRGVCLRAIKTVKTLQQLIHDIDHRRLLEMPRLVQLSAGKSKLQLRRR